MGGADVRHGLPAAHSSDQVGGQPVPGAAPFRFFQFVFPNFWDDDGARNVTDAAGSVGGDVPGSGLAGLRGRLEGLDAVLEVEQNGDTFVLVARVPAGGTMVGAGEDARGVQTVRGVQTDGEGELK